MKIIQFQGIWEPSAMPSLEPTPHIATAHDFYKMKYYKEPELQFKAVCRKKPIGYKIIVFSSVYQFLLQKETHFPRQRKTTFISGMLFSLPSVFYTSTKLL